MARSSDWVVVHRVYSHSGLGVQGPYKADKRFSCAAQRIGLDCSCSSSSGGHGDSDWSPRPETEGIEQVRTFMERAQEGFDSLDAAADAIAAYLIHRPRPRDTSGLARTMRFRGGRYYWQWDPAFFIQMVGHPEHVLRSIAMMKQAARTLSVPTLLIRGGSRRIQ